MGGMIVGIVITQPTNIVEASLSTSTGAGSVPFMPKGVALSIMSWPDGSGLPSTTRALASEARRSTSVRCRSALASWIASVPTPAITSACAIAEPGKQVSYDRREPGLDGFG